MLYTFLFHNLVTFRIPFWQHSLHDVCCVFLQTSGFEGILDQPENEKKKKENVKPKGNRNVSIFPLQWLMCNSLDIQNLT